MKELNDKQMNAVSEYYRRIDELRKDGFRLSFDSSKLMDTGVYAAYLVHHNGTKVRLFCYLLKHKLVQKTNERIVYEHTF